MTRLKVGDNAPDFELRGVDEKTYSLENFKDAKEKLWQLYKMTIINQC